MRISKSLKPSARGKLEITSVSEEYLIRQQLKLQTLGPGFAWLNIGKYEAMAEATEFVKAVEKRTSLKIACPRRLRYILTGTYQQLQEQTGGMKGKYFEYLHKIIDA